MSTPAEQAAQAQLEAQVEWGTYTAATAIDVDGVRAFNPGSPVPKSHVDRGVVDVSQVVKVDSPPKVTKAAVADLAATLPAPVIGA